MSTFKHTDNTCRNANTKEAQIIYIGSCLEPEVSNLRVTFDYRSTEGYRISKHGVYYGAICSEKYETILQKFRNLSKRRLNYGVMLRNYEPKTGRLVTLR